MGISKGKSLEPHKDVVALVGRSEKPTIIKTRRKAIMMNWNINTIANEHNYSVEYIYVPFRDALFREKSI